MTPVLLQGGPAPQADIESRMAQLRDEAQRALEARTPEQVAEEEREHAFRLYARVRRMP
jgi:hypothetical protein